MNQNLLFEIINVIYILFVLSKDNLNCTNGKQ